MKMALTRKIAGSVSEEGLYSFDASGYMRSGGWYYLTGRGAMATGWLQLGDDWYYLGSDGAMYANRWYGNYYLTADGTWDPDREGDQLDTLLQQVIDQGPHRP